MGEHRVMANGLKSDRTERAFLPVFMSGAV
jgi:hypothetical protein